MPVPSPHAWKSGWHRPARKLAATLAAVPHAVVAGLHDNVDLNPLMPDPLDQGPLGSCTAQSVVAALYLLLRRQGLPAFIASRLALYLGGRRRIGMIGEDSGAIIADVLREAAEIGFGAEALWPYDVDRFTEQPPDLYLQDAATHRLVNWETLPHDLGTLQFVLDSGFPICFGIELYTSFWDAMDGDGRVHMPQDGEAYRGGHAMVLTGYDRPRRVFRGQNSWGRDVGMEGRFEIDEDYVIDPWYCGELHAVRVVREAA
jgi:hypothetical protein